MKPRTENLAITRAVELFSNGNGSGLVALAQALGVSKAAVSQWRTGDRQVPAERCPQIERVTAGRVRCEQLRPDVEWHVIRGTAAA
jgi:DNA-binding transcriptional regulator YdaS (Cro superfamily)